MIDLASLQTLMAYHYWANDRLLCGVDALSQGEFTQHLGGSFPTLQATLTHMTNAEALWLGRMNVAAVPMVEPADVPTPAALRARWATLEAAMRGFVGRLQDADLQQPVVVKLGNGREITHRTGEILQQLFNHGTYHRGQVTNMLRQLGGTPTQTDLLVYYRTQDGQLP